MSNYKKNLIFNSKWFTLIEVIIVVIIISIWLVWIFLTMKNSYKFLQNIKEKVVAVNLAREWVEWVFSIRNTNWQRWSGKKDQCWLKINPLVDNNNNWCENDDWFQTWSYVLDITWTQQYFYLSWLSNPLNLTWKISDSDRWYLLCKNTQTWLINACKNVHSKPSNYFDATLYFRQIRWGYLLYKNNNTIKNCSNWTDSDCWNGSFLEKNFCVDVFYFDGTKKKVTFCTVLTNFME